MRHGCLRQPSCIHKVWDHGRQCSQLAADWSGTGGCRGTLNPSHSSAHLLTAWRGIGCYSFVQRSGSYLPLLGQAPPHQPRLLPRPARCCAVTTSRAAGAKASWLQLSAKNVAAGSPRRLPHPIQEMLWGPLRGCGRGGAAPALNPGHRRPPPPAPRSTRAPMRSLAPVPAGRPAGPWRCCTAAGWGGRCCWPRCCSCWHPPPRRRPPGRTGAAGLCIRHGSGTARGCYLLGRAWVGTTPGPAAAAYARPYLHAHCPPTPAPAPAQIVTDRFAAPALMPLVASKGENATCATLSDYCGGILARARA